MAKLYFMISLLILSIQIQGIFGAMNITMGEIENNQLTQLSSGNGNGNGNPQNKITSFVCPSNGNCVGRGDPDYIVPKSFGEEKIDTVFTDITTLEGFENNKKGLIVEACNPKQLENKKCQTRKCAVNEDCLSGLCQNSSCIINKENPLSECTEKLGIMICEKYLQEPCIHSDECAGKCKDFVCTYKHLNSLNTSPWLYYSVPAVTAVCLIALFCCMCCCPGIFCCKAKEKRNNNPPVIV